MSLDDMTYALENTHILYEPVRRIDTFGNTRFEFVFLSEPMEVVGKTIVRNGWLEAERPKIIKPEFMNEIELDGFSDDAKRFLTWLSTKRTHEMLLQYGFMFKLSEVSQSLLDEPIEVVRGRISDRMREEDNPAQVLMEGVESHWEAGLLKFSTDIIIKSLDINLFDFNRKGLL